MTSIISRTLSWFSPSKAKKTPTKPISTPPSLPQWTALREPLSSPLSMPSSGSASSKRTIDELEEPEVPVTPAKKQVTKMNSVASSSSLTLDVLDDNETLLGDPTFLDDDPFVLRTPEVWKTYKDPRMGRSYLDSPCKLHADRKKSVKNKQVKFATLHAVSNSRPSVAAPVTPSATALGKRKEAASEQPEGNSRHLAPDERSTAPSKRRKVVPKPTENATRDHERQQEETCSKKPKDPRHQRNPIVIDLTVEDGAAPDITTEKPKKKPKKKDRKGKGKAKDLSTDAATNPTDGVSQSLPSPCEPSNQRREDVLSKKNNRNTRVAKETGKHVSNGTRNKRRTEMQATCEAPTDRSEQTAASGSSPKKLRSYMKGKKAKAPAESNGSTVSRANVARRALSPESPSEDQRAASEDIIISDEDSDWMYQVAQELGLSQDNIEVLRYVMHEPDDRKIVFLIALHMAKNPWEIPQETKSQLSEITQELLLDFSWPCFFKDREVNLYRFFEAIRGRPSNVGLDNSWTSDISKLLALRKQLLRHFSEARRRIIELIKDSKTRKLSVKELARSFRDREPTRSDRKMSAMLRQIYVQGGREGFFDRVDEQLRVLHQMPFKQARRKLREYLNNDERMFP